MRILKWALIILAALITGALAFAYTPDTDATAMRAKYGGGASRFLTLSPGLTVHVRDQGVRTGRALVLIHGSNASLHTWEPWVTRLQSQYRIITLDLPGHGLTGAHPNGRYDMDSYVDVVDQVMQRLGVPHAVLAGNSMGGGVSWNYALSHPEKVDALVLVDAAGAPSAKPRTMPIGFRIARMPGVSALAEIITPRSMFEASLKTSVYDPGFATPQMVDRYWELNRYPGNRAATMARFAQMDQNRAASPERLAAIKVPVLIMWGQEDNLIPVAAAKWFHKALPTSQLIIYPKVGHIPMEEIPDQSAGHVKRWLADVPFAATS
ncbi:MAG: alpha/beta fold hydrolase [Chakrabartia sp.]